MEKIAPFIFGKMAESINFTDREAETSRLVTNFTSAINTVLISPRRWGKTSLVAHAAEQAMKTDKRIKCCYIDLFSIRTEEEFYRRLGEAVLKCTSSRTAEIIRKAGMYFRHIVPKLTYSPDTNNDIELGLNWEEVKKKPDELINLAENIAREENIKLVVCIDEFQNIGTFDDPLAFQKKLRSCWQKHSHVAYCLYGSKRHMMMEVFASPSMPFYKFGDLIFLDKISEEDWVKFIVKRFKETGKNIDKTCATIIALEVDCHPFYVQQLAQLSWFRTKKKCTTSEIHDAMSSLLDQLDLLFQSITSGLATTQVNFLQAMLDGVQQFSAQETLRIYKLGTSANVQRIKQALMDKEIIDGINKKLVFLDPLYEAWLKDRYFGREEYLAR